MKGSKRITAVAIGVTIFNLVLFFVQLTPLAKATVGGMDYNDLRNDRDFERAVEYFIERCSVSGEKISC